MKIKQIKKFIIFICFLSLSSVSFITIAQDNTASGHNIFDDPDQDGLTSEEELNYGTDPNNKDSDNDGYSDGTEIMTGYDPLKPAPGDKIITDIAENTDAINTTDENQNLTTELSNNLVQLLSEKNGDLGSISQEDLGELLTDLNTDKPLTFEDLPKTNDGEIKILKQNYEKLSEDESKEKQKEDTVDYLTAIAYIAASNSPEEINEPEDIQSVATNMLNEFTKIPESGDSSYLLDISEKAENAYTQITEVEVPENMLELHTKGIQLAKYAMELKKDGTLDFDANDPIKTLLNISKAQQLFNLGMLLGANLAKTTQELDISEIPLEL